MKRDFDERDSGVSVELMASDQVLVTSALTEVEVGRNLTRRLAGEAPEEARARFQLELDAFALVAVDATTCNEAARITDQTLCRPLDSVHLASALRAGSATTLLTFDIRQAQAARSLGLSVVGF